MLAYRAVKSDRTKTRNRGYVVRKKLTNIQELNGVYFVFSSFLIFFFNFICLFIKRKDDTITLSVPQGWDSRKEFQPVVQFRKLTVEVGGWY